MDADPDTLRDDQRASEILDKIKQLMEQMLPSSDDANSKYTLASKLVKYSVGVVQDLSSCLEAIKGMDKLEPYVKQLEHLIKQPPVLLARLDRAHKELARVKQLHDKVDVLLDLDKDTVSDPEAMKASMDLVATMMHKLDMAGHRKKELEATCASRLEDLEHAHTDIQHLKVTVQDLQESISPLLKDIEHWKNLLAGTRKDLDVAAQDLRAAEARSAALAGERTELREMLTSLTEQKDDVIAGLRIELSGLKRVNAQQEEDMALAEAKHRASLDELADQVSDLKRLLAEEKTLANQLDHKFAKSTKEIEELRAKHESERESWKASVEEVKQRLLDAKTRGDDAHRLHQSALVQKEALETKLALQGQGLLQQREAAVAKEKEFKDDKAQSVMQIDTLEHKLAAALKEIDELNTRLVAQADEFKTDQEQLRDKLVASVERARWEESEKKKWHDGHAKQQALVEERQTDIQDLKNRLADLALKHAEELAASKASTEEVRRERETLRLEQGETAARLKDTQEALDKLRSDMEAQASKHTEALAHAGDLQSARLLIANGAPLDAVSELPTCSLGLGLSYSLLVHGRTPPPLASSERPSAPPIFGICSDFVFAAGSGFDLRTFGCSSRHGKAHGATMHIANGTVRSRLATSVSPRPLATFEIVIRFGTRPCVLARRVTSCCYRATTDQVTARSRAPMCRTSTLGGPWMGAIRAHAGGSARRTRTAPRTLSALGVSRGNISTLQALRGWSSS